MRRRLSLILGTVSVLFTYNRAFAADAWGGCVDSNGVATLACIPVVFNNVIDWALAFAGLTAAFFIVLSGIKFLTSGGDPKQVEGARKTMTYAIIGLIVIFLAFTIIQIISNVTDASCVALPFGFNNCP